MDPGAVDSDSIASYNRDGFTILRNVFTPTECDTFSHYFTSMVERGGDGYAESPVDTTHSDPLKRYPRLLQPHRRDATAFNYLTDARLRTALTALAGSEPYAVQTMVYFKPPGARGQNLHQDNLYLLVQPGTCIAAWLALDDCDEENGCMVFVPDTATLPIICQVETAGLEVEQWGKVETPRPPGSESAVPACMKKGDLVVFNGSVIHGSFKNRSESRFRRALIGHYVAAEATQVAKYYFPVFRMDGSRVEGEIGESAPGGPCGVYEEHGHGVRLSGSFRAPERAH